MIHDYLPILLQAIVAVLFAASALIFSVLLGKVGRPNATKNTAYECGMLPIGPTQPRFSVKFYLVAMLFILFDIEIVFMYPWAIVYKDMIRHGWTLHQDKTILWSMLSFVVILTVGYFYALKKGALNWKN